MTVTQTAEAMMAPAEKLPALLQTFSDASLDTIEECAKMIRAGWKVRITNHTPRGFVLSSELGQRVLSAVHAEQSRRIGL